MHTPEFVAQSVQLACLLEASAEKPGNVTPTRCFHDMRYEDFLRSAVAIGPQLALAGSRGVGATILACIQATRRLTQANTNLGIVLLFAPLARAALTTDSGLRAGLQDVLRSLSLDDARDAYAAIRLALPGGFEQNERHDIRSEPTVTLLEAMVSAAERDSIAAEYLNNFAVTFDLGLPLLRYALERGAPTGQAIVQTYIELLARLPDTLIARKLGSEQARAVSKLATTVVEAGGVFEAEGRAAITRLDETLRDANNRLNPGTTADLVAVVLFVALLEGVIK